MNQVGTKNFNEVPHHEARDYRKIPLIKNECTILTNAPIPLRVSILSSFIEQNQFHLLLTKLLTRKQNSELLGDKIPMIISINKINYLKQSVTDKL